MKKIVLALSVIAGLAGAATVSASATECAGYADCS